MKKNKKVSLLLIGLVLVFSLFGCSKDNTNRDKSDQDIVQSPQDEFENEDTDDVEEPLDEATNSIDATIESSDYISKIKLISKGSNNNEIKILDNIKGNLSPTDLPDIKNLEMNRTYVVFLKDDVDNTVVLTDNKNGVILLEGDNHELFEKINNKLHNK